jgi:hypothetical protein
MIMQKLLSRLRCLPEYVAIAAAVLVIFIGLVYYPVGMIYVHRINDSESFSAQAFEVDKGSHSLAMAIALIDRETRAHSWVASDPFFYPGSMLVRMPAFQRGILSSLARFGIELYDHIGRTRGSSQADADLQSASGLLNYSPFVWMFNFQTSWLPTASSPTQYRSAMESLKKYNARLGSGAAVFERRADVLIELIDRLASDLGSSSAALASHVEKQSGLSFQSSADLFYHTKGRLYADFMLLRELKKDFPDVIREKELESAWEQMLESLREGMVLGNFLIMNAAPDSQFFPNHLATQGFFVLRARTQMREISNILLK